MEGAGGGGAGVKSERGGGKAEEDEPDGDGVRNGSDYIHQTKDGGGDGDGAKEEPKAGVERYPWESKLESDRKRCPAPEDDSGATSFLMTQSWARVGCYCPVCV